MRLAARISPKQDASRRRRRLEEIPFCRRATSLEVLSMDNARECVPRRSQLIDVCPARAAFTLDDTRALFKFKIQI